MHSPVAAGIRSVLEQNITDAIIIPMDSDNITNSGKDDNKNGKSDKDANDGNEQENSHSYQVPISQEIINLLLIGNK